MANKRLDYDRIYELVMQCRQSGLSDRQWCLDNGIVPSTFYYWIRRLQQRACYDLPETTSRKKNTPAVAAKQDVVCVNIQDESDHKAEMPADSGCLNAAKIVLQYGDVKIALADDFDEQTLKRVFMTLREALC